MRTARRKFGGAGIAIGMIARKEQTLAAAGEALAAEGIASAGVAADAASEVSLKNAIAELRTLQGDPQVLVYNAFTDHRVAPAAQAVAPAMIRRGSGAIVVTGGGYALNPAAGRSSLSLSKAALRSLVTTLAQELELQGARVGTVTVFGQIKPNTAFSLERIAEEFFAMAHEPPGKLNERQFRG
jgi:short-subunit dehydrogenase